MDSLPAQMGRTEFRRVPAPGQVLHVFFVDVFFALVAMVAARHQLLAHGGVYLQVDDFIRGRQSQQPELILKQPLQKALPLLRTLIVLEGLDGSGKATQAKLLAQHLKEAGKNVQEITFPDYASDSSALVKMYLAGQFGAKPDDVNAYAASSFYAVDRYASYKTSWGSFYEAGGVIIAGQGPETQAGPALAKRWGATG